MAAVSTIRPEVRAIEVPRQLRDLQVWLVWRFEHGEGAKPRKVPYYANGGRRGGVQGRPEDRQRLVTFEAAKAAAARRGFDGVGVAVLPDTGLCWVDFDACADAAGIHPEVEALIAGTYSEFSPSGTGIRAVFVGDLGNRKSEAGGGRWGVETFSSNGFVTVTGNRTGLCDLLGLEDTIAPVSDAMRQVAGQRFDAVADGAAEPAEPLGLDDATIGQALDALDPDCGYQRWLEIGMALHHERGDEGLALWDAWSATGDKYPGAEVLAAKWESFGRTGRNPVTARRLVRYANEAGAHVELPPQAIDAAEFADLTAAEPGKPVRFQVVDAADYATRPPPAWLIKGVLPRAQLAVVYGASGAGKSFVVIDLAMSLARGQAWQGHRTVGGRVVVIAAEGAGGVRNRVAAYARQHDVALAGVPLGIIGDQPSFLKASADHKAIVKQIRAWGGADLVVVDTLAQVTAGGNENSAEDMGAALQRCRAISEATGALVLLVHHAGKDASRGARGWSGIRAAADAEIEVVRDGDIRIVELTKQKDGTDGLRWAFRLEPVVLGLDEDGDEITSCVVDYLPADQVPAARGTTAVRRLGKWESLVNAVIQEFAMAQTAGIEIQAVLDEALRRAEPAPEGRRDTRKQHIKRALDALFSADDAQYVAESDGTITLL